MQVRVDLRPQLIAATDGKVIKVVFLKAYEQPVGDFFEVPHRFVVYMAFDMAGIVSMKAVATCASRLRVHDLLTLAQFTERRLKDEGVLTVDHGDACPRRTAH